MPALWSLMAAPRPPKPLPITAALRSLDCVVAMSDDRFLGMRIFAFLPREISRKKTTTYILSNEIFSHEGRRIEARRP